MPTPLNYATEYSEALAQVYPYVLYFGDLYSTPNNGRYRWVNSKTIEIPRLSVTGRKDGNRDVTTAINRNFTNDWETKTLTNHREWDTSVHPNDIIETNHVASIQNITQTFNNEQKFPEMDAYLVSKLYADWTGEGEEAITVGTDGDFASLTADNVLQVFDDRMSHMTDNRVPATGRILYTTTDVEKLIINAKQIQRNYCVNGDSSMQGTDIVRQVTSIDHVKIVVVPKELMKTAYDFTLGWEPAVSAKQIHMFLVHPSAVITPVQYEFAKLDPPSAGSKGKYLYFEESFEDAFILNNKKHALQFVVEK